MHHPTDRITHTTSFVAPVVEHWLEREIAQWVHPMKDRSDDPSHHEQMLYLWATSRSMYVCMHVCTPMYVCNYVCMYVHMYIYIFYIWIYIVCMSGFDLIHTYSSDALAQGILKSFFAFTIFLMPLLRSEPVAPNLPRLSGKHGMHSPNSLCMHVCMNVCMYMYVWMCACLCVCIYACMYEHL